MSGDKEEDAPHREDYFEPISPDRNSVPQEGQYSDEGEVEEEQQEEGEDDEDDVDVEEEEDEDGESEGRGGGGGIEGGGRGEDRRGDKRREEKRERERKRNFNKSILLLSTTADFVATSILSTISRDTDISKATKNFR